MTHENRVQPMTSRERVLAALKGEPVDRIPVMYWLNPHMTCRLSAEGKAKKVSRANHFYAKRWERFINAGATQASEWIRLLPLAAEEYGNGELVLDLGSDIGFANPNLFNALTLAFSIRRKRGRLRLNGPLGTKLGVGGIYVDVVEHPIRSAADLNTYRFPKLKSRYFDPIRRYRDKHPDICTFSESLSFQQAVCDFILGPETFMLSLYDYPEELGEFFKRFAQWIRELIRLQAQAGADVAFLQDDYGSNKGPLISMEMWEKLTYPHLRGFIETAHQEDTPLVLHSCGNQTPFLPYYAETGLDGLQSFQPTAENDFEWAYGTYGERFSFLTGIDILSGERMPAEAFSESIRNNAVIGAKKNRFILSMTHMLQYTMSRENTETIFHTIKEITQNHE